jgi:nitrogen-specific signal transduction histidine kinase
MIYHKAAVHTLLLVNGEVLYVETLVEKLLDQKLSQCDRKQLAKKVCNDLKRLERDLMNLESYSERHSVDNLQSNIDYLWQKVLNLKYWTELTSIAV